MATKTTTNLDSLKINYLTQEMYDDALSNNEINENELYFTTNADGYTILDTTARTYDIRGLYTVAFNVTPANASDMTPANLARVRAVGYTQNPSSVSGSYQVYPLVIGYITNNTSHFFISCKAFSGNPQSTSSSTVNLYTQIIAPFKLSTIAMTM